MNSAAGRPDQNLSPGRIAGRAGLLLSRWGLAAFSLLLALASGCKPADNEAPRLDVLQGLPPVVPLGDSLPELRIEARDNRDCDLGARISIEGTVNTARLGDYRVDYRVSDEAGNESAAGFDVRVVMIKDSYYAVEYEGIDSCASGVFTYSALIDDCTCAQDEVLLYNLGNFGPGSYVNLAFSGDYGQELSLSRQIGPLSWSGQGRALPHGDSLRLEWQLSNGAETEQCRTLLIKRRVE
jgi:hypothetical protein